MTTSSPKLFSTLLFLLSSFVGFAQEKKYVSKVWSPDNGNGTYTNPIIHADYSDPDVIRVGKDFYLIASSFENTPGLPILHSRDLVNWSIIGHALKRQVPIDHFSITRHGEGVWAPSIRYHQNEFYIYYPDPDFGIYLVKSKAITGPWSDPVLVQAGKGLIDPCPLWDSDGKVYLVHAFAGSRAGFKSVIVVKEMNKQGTKTIDEGMMVYDGHEQDPTIEGPKFYKRNSYYYIFAPAGGVSTGWQLVLRSKNIYGPYERRVVMDQGSSIINGPHQGAWIQTESGQDWFIHFQDKEAYGRVLHLQPMKWVGDWPVIGNDRDGDGKGEPVITNKKPNTETPLAIENPVESDEFNSRQLGLQWQWQSNPQGGWAFPYPAEGTLRMYAQLVADSTKNQWQNSTILSQKFPAELFEATVKFDFHSKLNGDQFGLIVLGSDYAYLSFRKLGSDLKLSFATCANADKGGHETETFFQANTGETAYFRVTVRKGAVCQFSFSADGRSFTQIGQNFFAKPGRWTGAKMGLFCSRTEVTNDAAYADLDWFRIEKAD
jgi:beta-xylosidase